ncbi:hypothetical protein GCM10012275_60000 [Longimycelium tulufanense]|uniref:Uncharacterized protein n=1 Tax=Longimycelium tulufanense TaxID=907463 RepID=A0A8J3CIA3_9PSEU|nr:hypothetical protein [Longimycelium tulufanense]GGM81355.1 hypothetical protein GCM10012275_60000 [Longimycelium tulufanense]
MEEAAADIPDEQRPSYDAYLDRLRQLRTDLDGPDPASTLTEIRQAAWPARHEVDNWTTYQATFTTLATSTNLTEVKTALEWWIADLRAQSLYIPDAQRPDHDRYIAWLQQLRTDLDGSNVASALERIREVAAPLKQKYDSWDCPATTR